MKEIKKNTELKEDLVFSEKKLKVAVKKVIEIDNQIQDSFQEQIHLCHDINQYSKLNRGTVQGHLYTQHQVPSYVKALCYDTFELSMLQKPSVIPNAGTGIKRINTMPNKARGNVDVV